MKSKFPLRFSCIRRLNGKNISLPGYDLLRNCQDVVINVKKAEKFQKYSIYFFPPRQLSQQRQRDEVAQLCLNLNIGSKYQTIICQSREAAIKQNSRIVLIIETPTRICDSTISMALIKILIFLQIPFLFLFFSLQCLHIE